MNKSDLVSHIRQTTDFSVAQATQALEAVLEGIQKALCEGEDVRLVGFGSFGVQASPERIGRNPRTQEPMTLPASKRAVFKPGKEFKERLNT
jgi:DNA-binding protein HU-beta